MNSLIDNAMDIAAQEAIENHKLKILLVDDDPIFCRSMQGTAKLNQIDLQVCRNIGEVMKLQGKESFDAAVLDYQFGELTALQVGHFLSEDTPIVITSNHHRSDIHLSDWPFNIRDFVAKSQGNSMLLRRAVEVAGVKPNTIVEHSARSSSYYLWMIAIALIATALLGLWLPSQLQFKGREPNFFWDAVRNPLGKLATNSDDSSYFSRMRLSHKEFGINR